MKVQWKKKKRYVTILFFNFLSKKHHGCLLLSIQTLQILSSNGFETHTLKSLLTSSWKIKLTLFKFVLYIYL